MHFCWPGRYPPGAGRDGTGHGTGRAFAPGLVEIEQHSVVEHPRPLVESVSQLEHVRREGGWLHDLAAVGKLKAVAALPRGKPGLREHLLPTKGREGCEGGA